MIEATAFTLVGHVNFKEAKRRFIRRYLEELLDATHWNVQRAAYFAGVERSHFRRIMRSAGVSRVSQPVLRSPGLENRVTARPRSQPSETVGASPFPAEAL